MRCGLCGLISDTGLCSTCLGEFETIPDPVQNLQDGSVDVAIGLYVYGGRVAQAIQRLKYDRVTSLAEPLASLISQGFQGHNTGHWDLMAPVPIHWRRLCWRGFNQAELLASDLMTRRSKALLRIRATRPQVRLSIEERRTNLTGAFRADHAVQQRAVLLVDDVFTSGSTAQACGEALKAAGAARVGILTLAKGG